MKGCELCGSPARMFCESDQASLCWDCDEKVHRANFLVAKHCRNLLCQVCQSPTPWKASGPKLGPTVSVCESCFSSVHSSKIAREEDPSEESQESRDGEEEEEEESDGDSDECYEEEEAEEEDGENQVVPWSETASPVPPVASSSSGEDENSSGLSSIGGFLKRTREDNNINNADDLDSDDEVGCSSSQLGLSGRLTSNEEGSSSFISLRPLKQPRTTGCDEGHGQLASRSTTAIVDSLKRLQRDIGTGEGSSSASATILGICRLSRDQTL